MLYLIVPTFMLWIGLREILPLQYWLWCCNLSTGPVVFYFQRLLRASLTVGLNFTCWKTVGCIVWAYG